jgi:hypothetical protein
MHRTGLIGMVALLALTCSLSGSQTELEQLHRSQAPAANWTQPTAEEWRESAEADKQGQRAPGAGEIAFSFLLAEDVRATSAGVYDAQQKLLRTLWSARPYKAGAHRAIWDGKDDYGNQAPAESYTVKVLASNVHYDWEGVIGVTEDSLAGPHNWDTTASFPTSFAFLNGKAYVAGGYNEGRVEAFVFDEKTPFTVAPLNLALVTGGEFEEAATDGKRIYFADNHYWYNGSNAVVAFSPDGQIYNFPQGTVIPPMGKLGAYFINTQMNPPLRIPDARGLDVANFNTADITGLAVQRNGRLLASAHGARGGPHPVASLDAINLWDKDSGAAAGKIEGIQNPQRMTFDNHGDLWVIEGGPVVEWRWDRGARLARIHDVGGKNEITEPIPGLDNPVDVTVNPANGHLFVADGGASQQVKEFDPQTGKLLSTVGTKGGYGQGAACNATITPTSFWLDFNLRATGSTMPWIAVDEGGDLWVGDYTSNRILRFHQGKLVTRIEVGRWNYQASVPHNNPTRVFAGWHGMLEYEVNYKLPLEPTDPIDPAEPHSWKAVRNWYPCFLQAEAGQQDGKTATMVTAETLKDGQTYGLVGYHGGPFLYQNALVRLPESGRIEFVNNRITVFRVVYLDRDGNFYRAIRSGVESAPQFTIKRFAIAGFDAQGFPEWDQGTLMGSMAPDLTKGNPFPGCSGEHCDFRPTDGGIIPIYSGPAYNKKVAHGDPGFHLGGLPVNGTALQWQAMPEKRLRYPDGHGTYPAIDTRSTLGTEAHAIQRDIFAGINGNWALFSSQFYHYREDGLLVGQFGWRDSDEYPGLDWGRPDPWNGGEKLAPGYSGNTNRFLVVEVGKDYYLYNQDEGYRAGIHRWHIWNLDSVHELAASATLGATVQLAPAR